MTQIDIDEEIFIYLHFKISTNTSNILYRIPLKSLIMENDSEDRSNLVDHDVNNVKGKKSYFCQPRKTQEWGQRFFGSRNLTTDWQKERKKVENRKFLLVEKIRRGVTGLFLSSKKEKESQPLAKSPTDIFIFLEYQRFKYQ